MTYAHFDPQLLTFLQEHTIAFDYYEHIPVFTVEESEAVKHLIPGKHSKNLFLSDKKGHYYLVTIEAHKRFPVNLLRKTLGAKELSFGTAEELFTHLHLTPGSVSLFGLMYASPEHISLFIDHDLREADLVGRHPNRNDATLTIDHQNLQSFLTATGFAPTILRFDDTNIECTQTETAVLGGGCFRCLEGAFQQITGVLQVLSGYSGGKRPYPSYDQVSTGVTGHIEVIQLIYDPSRITYTQILEIFFSLHDPTTLDRQGNDIGPEYASVIFYTNNTQHLVVQELIQKLTQQHIRENPIVTQLRPLEKFWIAEAYHQNYYTNNPSKPYCQAIISPKLQKLRQIRKHLLKPSSSL